MFHFPDILFYFVYWMSVALIVWLAFVSFTVAWRRSRSRCRRPRPPLPHPPFQDMGLSNIKEEYEGYTEDIDDVVQGYAEDEVKAQAKGWLGLLKVCGIAALVSIFLTCLWICIMMAFGGALLQRCKKNSRSPPLKKPKAASSTPSCRAPWSSSGAAP